jgi:hypothetical protein
MEYLLVSSVALLIGSCLTAVILRPPVQIRQPASAGTGSRPGGGLTAPFRRSWRGLPGASSPVPCLVPVSPGPDLSPPAVFTRRQPVPVECHGDSVSGEAPPSPPQELRSVLEQPPPAVP